jgi:hypothetical protein
MAAMIIMVIMMMTNRSETEFSMGKAVEAVHGSYGMVIAMKYADIKQCTS